MGIRLLFIGFEEKDIPTVQENLDIYYEVRKWGNLPTLHDFDVIITDLHNLDGIDIKKAKEHKPEFLEQVQTGGLLIIFVAPAKIYRETAYVYHYLYEWIPRFEFVEIKEEPGESMKILESDFKPFLRPQEKKTLVGSSTLGKKLRALENLQNWQLIGLAIPFLLKYQLTRER